MRLTVIMLVLVVGVAACTPSGPASTPSAVPTLVPTSTGMPASTAGLSLPIPRIVKTVVGICGDQDGDGEVTILDTIIDMQVIAGRITATSVQLTLSDLDRDGEISVLDVILTLQHLVGKAEITECGLSLAIPVGVGLLTNYGFDVDKPEQGWPSKWGIGGWGWNSVVGIPGALWRSFVSNEPAPDFRHAGQTGFYLSDDPQVVDWQARKMMEAGFDFVVLDWHGWGDPDLDGEPGPAYIDQRANDTVTEWMRWFDSHPDALLQFAIFVHIFPISAGGLEGPLSGDHKQMILDYVWDNLYGPRAGRVFNWQGKPLLVTGFEMGFADADDERFRIRNWHGENPGPDDWQEGTQVLNLDGMAMIKPRWDEWWHYLAQHHTGYRDWRRPHGGFREDPYGKERLYDDHWRWLTEQRDLGELEAVWVISWNEYATKNYIEPDMGLGPGAVEETMVWKTAHYTNRLKAGERFAYYEPLWVDPQYVLRLAGNPRPEDFGFSTDPRVTYLDPVQLMMAEAKMHSLAVDAAKSAQGIVAEYMGCGTGDDAPLEQSLPETVRQATAEVAANILLRALVRGSIAGRSPTPEEQESLSQWVFGEDMQRAIEPFRCQP